MAIKILSASIVPVVNDTLAEWIKNKGIGVLVGSLAMSFYMQPRYTENVNLLFMSEDNIPVTVEGFKRTHTRAFVNRKHGVEVEIVTPSLIGIPESLAARIVAHAKSVSGILIARLEGLVAMKLHSKCMKDHADIVEVLKVYPNLSLEGWPISSKHRNLFDQLANRAKKES